MGTDEHEPELVVEAADSLLATGQDQRDAAIDLLTSWLAAHPEATELDDVARALVRIGGEGYRDRAVATLIKAISDHPDDRWLDMNLRALVELGGESYRSMATQALTRWLTRWLGSPHPSSDWVDEMAMALADLVGEVDREEAIRSLSAALANSPHRDNADSIDFAIERMSTPGATSP